MTYVMSREELLALHDESCQKAKALMIKKNADYSAGDDPFANFRMAEAVRVCQNEGGIMLRLCDKLSRMSSFLKTGEFKVADEKMDDTVFDAINYCILFLGMHRERQRRLNEGKKNIGDVMVDVMADNMKQWYKDKSPPPFPQSDPTCGPITPNSYSPSTYCDPNFRWTFFGCTGTGDCGDCGCLVPK